MEIMKEDTGALTASVKIMITKEDYEDKVNKTLKEYQRKANIPGFRPGKVPFGMISKMYRKGVLLDEINHLLSENLQNYIADNKLDILGNPVPNKEKAAEFDIDTQTDFEFVFDLGLKPEFTLDLSSVGSVDYYKITATDKMIEEQVHELQHRFYHQDHPEKDGDHNEEEHHHDEELPELNEAFFDKIFPGAEIKDEASFKMKIKESLESSLTKESERFFMNSAVEKLIKETAFDLPDEFLRKSIRETSEKEVSDEQFEIQYANFTNSLRWQLIEYKLIENHNIRVGEDEMRNVVKGYFSGYSTNPAEDPEQEERLNKIADSVLNNEQEANRLHDQLFDQKMLAFLKSNLSIENKEITYDDFIKMVTQKKD